MNDADNGEPVSGVYIVLNPGGKTANTGSDGRFEFLDMEPGQDAALRESGHDRERRCMKEVTTGSGAKKCTLRQLLALGRISNVARDGCDRMWRESV